MASRSGRCRHDDTKGGLPSEATTEVSLQQRGVPSSNIDVLANHGGRHANVLLAAHPLHSFYGHRPMGWSRFVSAGKSVCIVIVLRRPSLMRAVKGSGARWRAGVPAVPGAAPQNPGVTVRLASEENSLTEPLLLNMERLNRGFVESH
ncbi:unnamed protein product [Lota lota]